MKYTYLYQTKQNENKSGEIKAPNRAEAYAALRKQGIRPYRLIGDDPKNWRPWIIGGVIASLVVVIAALLFSLYSKNGGGNTDLFAPAKRAQISGDIHEIARMAENNWADVLSTNLDRLLSAYAQPGWNLGAVNMEEVDLDVLEAELATPLERREDERQEVRELKNIISAMRADLKAHIVNGGTIRDYLEFLEERQQRECDIRAKALETLEKAPDDMKRRAWANLNTRLADMGLAPLPEPGREIGN
ncbi:MAG: hypothetical protein IJQ34_05975 [Kiritimatiellae bacterium]|nr:hypothetical protein [Kiritimatiellia bacterium]